MVSSNNSFLIKTHEQDLWKFHRTKKRQGEQIKEKGWFAILLHKNPIVASAKINTKRCNDNLWK